MDAVRSRRSRIIELMRSAWSSLAVSLTLAACTADRTVALEPVEGSSTRGSALLHEASTKSFSIRVDAFDPAGDAQCTGAPEGQICQPWYEPGTAPRGYEDVGTCALPA